jgi:hypothetical protein
MVTVKIRNRQDKVMGYQHETCTVDLTSCLEESACTKCPLGIAARVAEGQSKHVSTRQHREKLVSETCP